MRAVGIIRLIHLCAIIAAGCSGPAPLYSEGPEDIEEFSPARLGRPTPRIPPDTAEPLVLECFLEPFDYAEPYYWGRETLVCRSGRWRVEYDLETGAGSSEGVLLPGLAALAAHPPGEGEERALGRPGLTHRVELLTDGPSLGPLAVILAGLDLMENEKYRLPARDLRQGADYLLELAVGGWSEVETAWGARRCLKVMVEPQGFTFHLDETGWPWSVRWPGGYAERAEYARPARRRAPVEEREEPAPSEETAPPSDEEAEPLPDDGEDDG